jgi:hypothetical protein
LDKPINQDSITGMQEFVENIVEYNNTATLWKTANAVNNCTHNMIGMMVKQAVQKDCAFA